MELLHKPWVWVVGVVVAVLVLGGGRRGGSMSNLSEVNAIAADTNVKLSAISAGTTNAAYAFKTREAEIEASKYFAGVDSMKGGISNTNAILLQHLQSKRDVELAGIAANSSRIAENVRLAAVKSTNATTLALGKIAAKVRGQEIAIAPQLAAINAETSKYAIRWNAGVRRVEAEYDYMARHDEARYAYKAAKAGANADMVGSALGAATSFGF